MTIISVSTVRVQVISPMHKSWKKYEIRNKTLRKRKAKGKLFRKSCNGCVAKEEYEKDKNIVMCKMPYKAMQFCPCSNCLVKVTCSSYCERYENVRRKHDVRYRNWLKRVNGRK